MSAQEAYDDGALAMADAYDQLIAALKTEDGAAYIEAVVELSALGATPGHVLRLADAVRGLQ